MGRAQLLGGRGQRTGFRHRADQAEIVQLKSSNPATALPRNFSIALTQ